MGLREWLFGTEDEDEDEDESESRTEQEVRQLTKEYTVSSVRIVYPDGTEESVEFTKIRWHDDVVRIYDHGRDNYYFNYPSYYSWDECDSLRPDLCIHYAEPRIFSKNNIREIDYQYEHEYVAVCEIDVEVTYDGDDEVLVEPVDLPDQPNVTVWAKAEWEARDEE